MDKDELENREGNLNNAENLRDDNDGRESPAEDVPLMGRVTPDILIDLHHQAVVTPPPEGQASADTSFVFPDLINRDVQVVDFYGWLYDVANEDLEEFLGHDRYNFPPSEDEVDDEAIAEFDGPIGDSNMYGKPPL